MGGSKSDCWVARKEKKRKHTPFPSQPQPHTQSNQQLLTWTDPVLNAVAIIFKPLLVLSPICLARIRFLALSGAGSLISGNLPWAAGKLMSYSSPRHWIPRAPKAQPCGRSAEPSSLCMAIGQDHTHWLDTRSVHPDWCGQPWPPLHQVCGHGG